MELYFQKITSDLERKSLLLSDLLTFLSALVENPAPTFSKNFFSRVQPRTIHKLLCHLEHPDVQIRKAFLLLFAFILRNHEARSMFLFEFDMLGPEGVVLLNPALLSQNTFKSFTQIALLKKSYHLAKASQDSASKSGNLQKKTESLQVIYSKDNHTSQIASDSAIPKAVELFEYLSVSPFGLSDGPSVFSLDLMQVKPSGLIDLITVPDPMFNLISIRASHSSDSHFSELSNKVSSMVTVPSLPKSIEPRKTTKGLKIDLKRVLCDQERPKLQSRSPRKAIPIDGFSKFKQLINTTRISPRKQPNFLYKPSTKKLLFPKTSGFGLATARTAAKKNHFDVFKKKNLLESCAIDNPIAYHSRPKQRVGSMDMTPNKDLSEIIYKKPRRIPFDPNS